MDLVGAEAWIRDHVEPVGGIETEHERPWATVLRVPLAGGVAWFKACAPVQAFEPWLTAELFARHPDRVAEVLGHDEERAWLLLGDAGTPIGAFGNPAETWLVALPRHAELQRGEVAHTLEHLAHGVPDLRVATLPARYDDLLRRDLPLERRRSIGCARSRPASRSCAASSSHTMSRKRFSTTTSTWRTCTRRAGSSACSIGAFALAMRVGAFAHAIAWLRQRDHLSAMERTEFDRGFRIVLRRAIAQIS